MKTIGIIGAGLVGALTAIYLARRGYAVDIFEARADSRGRSDSHSMPADSGRSINLAMSCRGITGLSEVGLMPAVERLMVPMRARAIHDASGGIRYQPFGRHEAEHINAIQRDDLNKLLLDEAATFPSVHFHFGMKLMDLDVERKEAHFQRHDGSRLTHPYQHLIGADGAASQVRERLQQGGLIKASRTFFSHGYKEITITGAEPNHLAQEHLHLWPRDSLLLLGNPNLDQSVTGSLFLPMEGKNSFAELDSEPRIRTFFEQKFPDVVRTMPDLAGDFLNHATGHMSTVKAAPWHHEDQCLLIGDAAHGLIPFFGQGMNSGFEDCRILNDLLDRHDDNWAQVMPAFYRARKPNTDAVCDMSMANYHEIQTGIRDPHFNLKKQLEQQLMQRYPARYVSKHVLVMFTNTPYAAAMAHGAVQNAFLERICEQAAKISDVDWPRVDALMRDYDKALSDSAPSF